MRRYQNCKTVGLLMVAVFVFLQLLNVYVLKRREKHAPSIKEMCEVKCETGIPCEYPDEVDFRIIVLTFDRANSLNKTLDAILKLETLNDEISVDIWIDRSKDGQISRNVTAVAENFSVKFSNITAKRRACVHLHSKNTYITGQWLDSWRPKIDTNEIGLILEDDISISPLSYKWLKLVHKKYGQHYANQIAGHTLQMESIKFFSEKHNKGKMKGPDGHQVFLYPVLGTWGFAPHPKTWRQFQDWYREVRPNRDIKTDKIKPFVPGIVPTKWYKGFLRKGTQESMWEMWHIKFTHKYKLFTVYSNLLLYTKKKEVLLSNNRKEDGLHFKGKVTDNSKLLLRKWTDNFETVPPFEKLAHYNYNGDVCTEECCFNTTCL